LIVRIPLSCGGLVKTVGPLALIFLFLKFVRCVRSGVNSTAAVADFYRRAHMLPHVTSSSGCCALRPRFWSRYNPPLYIGVACVGNATKAL